MDKKRRKWNARELFIMINEGLMAGCRQDVGKGRNTFWKNCGKIYSRSASVLFRVASRGRRIQWGHT